MRSISAMPSGSVSRWLLMSRSQPYGATGTAGWAARYSASWRRPPMTWARSACPGRRYRQSWLCLSDGFRGGAELAEEFRGELVGYAEAGAEGVAGDGLAAGVVVLGGDLAGEVEQRPCR
jgi:hypothetical protein